MWEVDEPVASKGLVMLEHFENIKALQMFVAELSVGSAPVPIWAGVDTDVYDASQIQHGSASGGR